VSAAKTRSSNSLFGCELAVHVTLDLGFEDKDNEGKAVRGTQNRTLGCQTIPQDKSSCYRKPRRVNLARRGLHSCSTPSPIAMSWLLWITIAVDTFGSTRRTTA